MFFTSQLLAQRDSGFGLLWLAATLGDRGSLKKLSKRNVLTADISELCIMIIEPEEPLSLRLASNLMVGVTRIHRAQQDALYNDALNCDATIKRAIAQTSWDTQVDGLLTLRNDQINIVHIPIDFDFDTLDPQNITFTVPRPGEPFQQDPDASYNVDASQFDRAALQSACLSQLDRRSKAHLLDEKHEMDCSFNYSGPSDDPYIEEINEPLFPDGEDIDLGVDFGQPAEHFGQSDDLVNDAMGWGDQARDRVENAEVRDASELAQLHVGNSKSVFSEGIETRSHKPPSSFGAPPTPLRAGNDLPFDADFQMDDPFQDMPMMNDEDIQLVPPNVDDDAVPPPPTSKPRSVVCRNDTSAKRKHGNAIWDEKIELTDDELRASRDGYEERMRKQRRIIEQKEHKDKVAKGAHEMHFAPPMGILDPTITRRWNDMMKTHFARNQNRANDGGGFVTPALPKQKLVTPRHARTNHEDTEHDAPFGNGYDAAQPFGVDDNPFYDDGGMNQDYNMTTGFGEDINMPMADEARQRGSSIDQAEQGRKGSKPSSMVGSLLGSAIKGSHRSSIAPWDPNSAIIQNDEEMNIADAFDAQGFPSSSVRGSANRRHQRLPSSSVSPLLDRNHNFGAPFGDEDMIMDTQEETQRTDISIASMEKQSLLFLTHLNSKIDPVTRSIAFSELLEPRKTTRAVAASGFYHLLELSTKRHLRVEQDEPFGPITITLPNEVMSM